MCELSVFLVTPSSHVNGPPADLSDVNGVSCRKRRRHAKTRSGCVACKKRRVKCDETYPTCQSCLKRGISCSLSASTSRSAASHGPPLSSPRLIGLAVPGLNMLQSRLLHHFGVETVKTLPFGGPVWRDDVIPLAFKHDFLMHAILLLSAQHLSYLLPDCKEYHQASLVHLSKLLPLYREELSRPLTIDNADATMGTGCILIYYLWSNVDLLNYSEASCFAKDPLFAMTTGMREIFLILTAHISSDRSIFSESAQYRPKFPIKRIARRCRRTLGQSERYLVNRFHRGITFLPDAISPDDSQCSHADTYSLLGEIRPETLGQAGCSHDAAFFSYHEGAIRLAPLLSIASHLEVQSQCSGKPPDLLDLHKDKSLQPNHAVEEVAGHWIPTQAEIARYIFSWPVLSFPDFIGLLEAGDVRAIFLLYQFYKAVDIIMPKTYWWARERASKMMSFIERNWSKDEVDPLESSESMALPPEVVEQQVAIVTTASEGWRAKCWAYGHAGSTQCCAKHIQAITDWS